MKSSGLLVDSSGNSTGVDRHQMKVDSCQKFSIIPFTDQKGSVNVLNLATMYAHDSIVKGFIDLLRHQCGGMYNEVASFEFNDPKTLNQQVEAIAQRQDFDTLMLVTHGVLVLDAEPDEVNKNIETDPGSPDFDYNWYEMGETIRTLIKDRVFLSIVCHSLNQDSDATIIPADPLFWIRGKDEVYPQPAVNGLKRFFNDTASWNHTNFDQYGSTVLAGIQEASNYQLFGWCR